MGVERRRVSPSLQIETIDPDIHPLYQHASFILPSFVFLCLLCISANRHTKADTKQKKKDRCSPSSLYVVVTAAVVFIVDVVVDPYS